jgi:opacity protein-like surface antigen
MNKFSKMILATTALIAVSSTANAAVNGLSPYVRGNLQYLFSSNEDARVSGVKFNSDEEAGLGISGAVGTKLLNDFRVEAEVLYFATEIENTNTDIDNLAFMVNGYYDLKTSTKFTPYVGAGIGLANIEVDAPAYRNSDNVFAYQALVGVSYELDKNSSVTAGYRYFGTQDSEYNGIKRTYGKNVLEVGYRYSF